MADPRSGTFINGLGDENSLTFTTYEVKPSTPPAYLSFDLQDLTEDLSISNGIQPKSSHEVRRYKDQTGKSWHVKFADRDPSTGKTILQNQMAVLLEVYFYELCRPIAAEFTPEVKLVYSMEASSDNQSPSPQIIAVATQSVPYLSNKSSPLKADHLLIKCLEPRPIHLIEFESKRVISTMVEYHLYLKDSIKKKNAKENVGYGVTGLFGAVDYLINATKSIVNTNLNPALTTDQMNIILDTELAKLNNLSTLLNATGITEFKNTIDHLVVNFRKRRKHISELKQDSYQIEMGKLDKLISDLERLEKLINQPEKPLPITTIEKFYLAIRQKGLDPNNLASPYYTETIDNVAITISADDIKNYALQRCLTIILVLRWYFEDPDTHNNNLGNFIIDTDMFLFRVTQYIKSQNMIDRLPRLFSSANFDIIENDIKKFPVLENWLGYWVTNTYTGKSKVKDTVEALDAVVSAISSATLAAKPMLEKLDSSATKNWFTDEDSQNFQKLAACETVHFHKYATLLSLLLTAGDLDKLQARVYMPETQSYWKTNSAMLSSQTSYWKNGDTLFSAINTELSARQKELRSTLRSMLPNNRNDLSARTEFENFLHEHGKFVLNSLKTKLLEYKVKTATTLPMDNPTCKELVNHVDLLIQNIEKNYENEILNCQVTEYSMLERDPSSDHLKEDLVAEPNRLAIARTM